VHIEPTDELTGGQPTNSTYLAQSFFKVNINLYISLLEDKVYNSPFSWLKNQDLRYLYRNFTLFPNLEMLPHLPSGPHLPNLEASFLAWKVFLLFPGFTGRVETSQSRSLDQRPQKPPKAIAAMTVTAFITSLLPVINLWFTAESLIISKARAFKARLLKKPYFPASQLSYC
jgi:hypothetical protein